MQTVIVGPTGRFKRVMCIYFDGKLIWTFTEGREKAHVDRGRGVKSLDFLVDLIKDDPCI